MKIVAFLESPSGAVLTTKEFERYQHDQVWHRQMLRQSMSGNRLYQAFGDLYEKIWWDNVAPKGNFPDGKHIDDVIREQKPDLILTFGGIARDALDDSIGAINIERMDCHHPNARHRSQADLDHFAMIIRVKMREFNLEV
jgi:hypothetical protein